MTIYRTKRNAVKELTNSSFTAFFIYKAGVFNPYRSLGRFMYSFIAACSLLVLKFILLKNHGCGANGDAIDLTAKLFDLNPRQAAEKLINDFAFAKQCSPQWGLQVTERSCVSKMEGPRPDKLWLDPDKPPANAIALLPPKRGLTDEQWADIAYCLRVLTDYLDLLHDWRERYKPATPEEPHDPRFEEALHATETIEHLTDCVAFGTPQQKADAAARLLSGSFLLMLEERTDRLSLAKCA